MSGHSQKAASCALHLFFKMILSKIFHYIIGFCYNWLPFQNKLATLEKNVKSVQDLLIYMFPFVILKVFEIWFHFLILLSKALAYETYIFCF